MARRIDKKVVRLSFDSATESCVRLAAFGSIAHPLSGKTGYCNEIADELAHKDLLSLAISGRRLAEAGNLYELAKDHNVSSQLPIQLTPSRWEFRATDTKVSLWELFGRIIHSSEFEIVADDFWIKSAMEVLSKDFHERYQSARFKSKFKPLFRLTTDREPILLCEIDDVAQRTLEFLEAAADELQNHEIDVGTYVDKA